MAYGDAFARTVGGITGATSRAASIAGTVGGIYDIYSGYTQAQRDADMAEAALTLQTQVAQEQLNMARQQAANDELLRQDILNKSAQLDADLKAMYAKLGPGVGYDQLMQDYQINRDRLYQQANEVVDRVSSQGYASAITRGMDRSTQFTDQQAELIKKTQSQLPSLDQAAFDAALGRANSQMALRKSNFDEISGVYNPAMNAQKGLITGQGMAGMNNAVSNYGAAADDYAKISADSTSGFAKALGNFSETIAPNIGYGFGTNSTYTDTSRDLKKDQALAAAGLKWDPTTQTYKK
jgi:hypothetical protein